MKVISSILLVAIAASASAFETAESANHFDITHEGKIWLRTMVTPFDEANREDTYKVFTHVYDFSGAAPITKGAGGKYTHHRGLFIGWKDTRHDGASYDTWHMHNCTQEHVDWLGADSSAEGAWQRQRIDWKNNDGDTFIEETRTIEVRAGANGMRIIDFTSSLTAKGADIALRGDLQHAGMQIRMANEVTEHEDTTSYILPPGVEELDNDEVPGAWWACASVEVGGKRYSVLHMTPPDHPGGTPVYSIRRYARFGAFTEPDLKMEQPVEFRFRIIVSEEPLDQAACVALYSEYSGQ